MGKIIPIILAKCTSIDTTLLEQTKPIGIHAPFLRRDSAGPSAPRPAAPSFARGFLEARRFWVLTAWLVLVFALGGASRENAEPLLLLRPLSVLVLAYGLAGLTRTEVASHRFLLAMAAAWLALHLVHLMPIPPQIWQAMPGREIVADVDQAVGFGDIWRPLSMAPYATRNAAWALLVPVAALLLGVRLGTSEREKLLPLLIAFGLLSALIGGLQLLGDPDGPLYFYDITNRGSAVGLFANRNHQAVLLASVPPMLFAWAALGNGSGRSPRRRWAAAAAGTLFVIPLILVTGSRAGLLTSAIGLLAVPAIVGAGYRKQAGGRAILVLVVVIAALLALTVALGRGIAFDRLLGSADNDDLRFRALPTLLAMLREYMPWGSGLGSFAEVYRLHEPAALLSPVYLNHAHNDWLEIALTGGLPAVALALVAAGGFLARLYGVTFGSDMDQDQRRLLLSRLGLLLVLMLALASLGDYPLRTPSLACLAVVAALWAAPARSDKARS